MVSAGTMTTRARQERQSVRDTTKAISVLPYGPEQSRWFIQHLQETRREHWRRHCLVPGLSPDLHSCSRVSEG